MFNHTWLELLRTYKHIYNMLTCSCHTVATTINVYDTQLPAILYVCSMSQIIVRRLLLFQFQSCSKVVTRLCNTML